MPFIKWLRTTTCNSMLTISKRSATSQEVLRCKIDTLDLKEWQTPNNIWYANSDLMWATMPASFHMHTEIVPLCRQMAGWLPSTSEPKDQETTLFLWMILWKMIDEQAPNFGNQCYTRPRIGRHFTVPKVVAIPSNIRTMYFPHVIVQCMEIWGIRRTKIRGNVIMEISSQPSSSY